MVWMWCDVMIAKTMIVVLMRLMIVMIVTVIVMIYSPSTNPEADKLRGLKKKVSDVTDIMKGNIEKVMDRGERLEELEDQTDILRVWW